MSASGYMCFLFVFFTFHHPSEKPSACAAYPPRLSHETWNALLAKYVTAGGVVNYKGLLSDKEKLNSYLEMLGSNPPQQNWPEREVLAYWINAYNAFTVKLVTEHYPLKSITEINNGKPWDVFFIAIGIKKYSLNMIENEVLRKNFNDPRIHFSINCASQSCPVLLNEAYAADKLDEQMNNAAKKFVNDPAKNKITGGNISISKIFDWYQSDFTSHGTVIDFLNQYAASKIQSTATISYLNYDWSLNEK